MKDIIIGTCAGCNRNITQCACNQIKNMQQLIDSGEAKILPKRLNIQTIDGCVLHILDVLGADKRNKENREKVKTAITSYTDNRIKEKTMKWDKIKEDARKYHELKRLLK